MKVNTQQLAEKLSVSAHTVNRFKKVSPDFPKPERIGRTDYFDSVPVCEWLNSRATRNSKPITEHLIANTDNLLSVAGTGDLLNRSGAWVWASVTKNSGLTQVNLSPSGDSANPRRYFVEREIRAAFPELVELQEAA